MVLLDFWGPRCRSCQAFAPVFEKGAQCHPDLVFGKVDTEAHPQLAAMFRVMSLPTLVVMKDNFVIYAGSGALPRGPRRSHRPGACPGHGHRTAKACCQAHERLDSAVFERPVRSTQGPRGGVPAPARAAMAYANQGVRIVTWGFACGDRSHCAVWSPVTSENEACG